MKKITASVLFTGILLGVGSGNIASASEAQSLSGHDISSDYKIVMKEVKQSIDSKEANTPTEVDIYNKFQNLYSKKELKEFHSKLDAVDPKAIAEKTAGVELGKNETRTILLNDGSLIILKNETGPVKPTQTNENTNNSIIMSAVPIYNGISGGDYYNKVYEEVWGIVKSAEVHNTLNFKLYTDKAVFTSGSAAGTKAFVPATVDVGDRTVTGNKTRTLTSSYDYNVAVIVAGTQLGNKYVSLGNRVKVISNVGNSVNYTTSATYSGF